MVRETRHLWVGNLPENIREDRIREHFKRYGRVQSVKLLGGRGDKDEVCATVSFMDIKSAAKAHHSEQKLDERILTTEYHEPAAIPTPNYSRFHLGGEELSSGFDRSSHFYERGGGGAGAGGGGGGDSRERGEPAGGYARSRSGYLTGGGDSLSRARPRDRPSYRNGPYTPIIESVVSRSGSSGSHHGSSRPSGGSWPYESPTPRYPSASDLSYPDPASILVHKKHSKSRHVNCRSGSDSGSNSSRSRSSSASSQSGSSTCSSSSSPASEKSCSTHSQQSTLRSGNQSSANHCSTSPAIHSDDRRPLAICVRNLPARSSDTSLKDGLYHEYKKHGKVTWVKVVGQGVDRYALVSFKKPEDVEKALQVSHDKLFFGCKIEVAPYQGYDVEDNEFRPFEAEQDEFHPKATRTLFIGNLDKDITAQEIRKHFDQFGEIIDIDIKKQGTTSSYAFCQFSDISSVVKAMRSLDGEHVGGNRVKLGFGKSMHTPVVWVDGVAESVSEKYLHQQFSQFGVVNNVDIDRVRGQALVTFDQISQAQAAVKEMRGVPLRGKKLQVDYCSRECQEAFFDRIPDKQPPSSAHQNYEGSNSIASSPSNLRVFESPSSLSGSQCCNATVPARFNSCQRYATSTNSGSGVSVTVSNNRVVNAGTASPAFHNTSPSSRPSRHSSRSAFEYPTTPSSHDFERRTPFRCFDDSNQGDGGNTPTLGSGEIRHLQKDRVSLLEQLDDCTSSGEEGNGRRRCNKHRRSVSGESSSRPGTPLCDERPENIGPVEPRRPRESRPQDPLSLPLPRFASQVLSPRPAPPSPPASPLTHSSSSDSEPSPEWEERLRSLDEKYEKWSGSRAGVTKIDPSTVKVRHKLLDLDLHELQPSEIVKSVLAKRSVFDEDSKRLENFGEKYEPREFIPARSSLLRGRIDLSPMSSPISKSPSSPAAKGLQYPFPSHPPIQLAPGASTTTPPSCTSVTIEGKPSLTFLTNCSTSRQFSFPKISSPQAEKCDISPRPAPQKPLPNPPQGIKPLPLPMSKPIQEFKKDALPNFTKGKSHIPLRRESSEEKKEDGRRRSRDESAESLDVVKHDDTSECDKVKDSQITERRKSVSEKRRNSSDLKENDKLKDILDKRRGSSESDSDSKKSEKRVFEENHLDSTRSVSEADKTKKVPVDHLERRKEELNMRLNAESDKKKEVPSVNSEKERRRNRESSESSETPKHKKVPDSKKDIDSIEKHDKDDDAKTVEPDRLKDLHDQASSQHRHKDKKDHQERRRDSSEHSEKKHERLSPDNADVQKPKEKKSSHDLNDAKNSKKHHDDHHGAKHKEERRKNSETEISKEHSLFKKVFGFAERTSKDRRDSDSTAVKTDDNVKAKRDYSEKESKREKDSEHSDSSSKHKSRKSPEQTENNRHKDRKHSELLEKKSKRDSESQDDHKLKEDNVENSFLKSNRKEERLKGGSPLAHDSVPASKHDRRKDPSYDESKGSETDSNDLRQKDGEPKKDNEAYFERRKDDHYENKSKEERRKHSDKYFDGEKYNNDRIKKDNHESFLGDSDKKVDSSETNKFKSDKYRDNEKKKDYIENCRNKEDHLELSKHKEDKRCEEIFDSLKSPKEENMRFKDSLKKKDSETRQEHVRIRDIVDTKKKEEKEKRKDGESQDLSFKKIREMEEKNRDYDKNKRKKDFENCEVKINGDHEDYLENVDCSRKLSYDEDIRIDPIKKERKRDKNSWPATIGCKRRLSSQESLDIEEDAKRCKPERRDSKDSGRSSGSSRKGSSEKHKGFTKPLEEKIREDKELEQRRKEEILSESSEKGEDKLFKPAIRKEKRNSSEKRKEERKFKSRPRENGTASESDMASGDEETKANKDKQRQHSIFDIVVDEPAYISMYDKVKARSTKNMQKQEEEKKQGKIKEKFHLLKVSRAKREEKKRSTSYDEDSDLEKGGCRRSHKLLTSSEDDACSESDIRIRSRKTLCDTSEDDSILLTSRSQGSKFSEYDSKSSRKIISDASDDEIVIKHSTPKVKSSRNISFESDMKLKKITSDTSEDDNTHHNSSRLKASRIHSDDSEGDLGFEDSRTESSVIPTKPYIDAPLKLLEPTIKITDVFASRPVEMNHFASPDLEQKHQQSSPESLRRVSLDSVGSEQPRKKSHKKKQKKKSYEVSEDGTIIIRKHSSKKDKKKHRENEDDDKKSRKKKGERESSNKHEEKYEEIFGPLSDDSEKSVKLLVSQVYGTDSESERENIRKKEKKRREKKQRELDETASMGRALEAKLLDTSEEIIEEPIKTKKKKRKKSRDEKSKHHRIIEDISSSPVRTEDISSSPVRTADISSPAFRERADIAEVIEPECITLNDSDDNEKDGDEECKMIMGYDNSHKNDSGVCQPTSSLSSLLDSPPPSQPVLPKKPDIPGFGSELDENIHETAVKSISESNIHDNPSVSLENYEEKSKQEEQVQADDKPTPVISQEETEDAVAALLMEDTFGSMSGFDERFTEEPPKPDTPVSEPDLQIDTDTEDNFDQMDSPKPSRESEGENRSYYEQADTREGLEERILPLACPIESQPNKEPIKKLVPEPVTYDNKTETVIINNESDKTEKESINALDNKEQKTLDDNILLDKLEKQEQAIIKEELEEKIESMSVSSNKENESFDLKKELDCSPKIEKTSDLEKPVDFKEIVVPKEEIKEESKANFLEKEPTKQSGEKPIMPLKVALLEPSSCPTDLVQKNLLKVASSENINVPQQPVVLQKAEKVVHHQGVPASHTTVLVHQTIQQTQASQVKPLTIQVLNHPPALKPLDQPTGMKSTPGPPTNLKLNSPPIVLTTTSASSFQQKPLITNQSSVAKPMHHLSHFQRVPSPLPHLMTPHHLPVKQTPLQTPQLTPILKGNNVSPPRPLIVHTIQNPPSQKQLHVISPTSPLLSQPLSPQLVIRPVQGQAITIRPPVSPQPRPALPPSQATLPPTSGNDSVLNKQFSVKSPTQKQTQEIPKNILLSSVPKSNNEKPANLPVNLHNQNPVITKVPPSTAIINPSVKPVELIKPFAKVERPEFQSLSFDEIKKGINTQDVESPKPQVLNNTVAQPTPVPVLQIKESKPLVEPSKNKTLDGDKITGHHIMKMTLDEPKPLNSVIQDLTIRAANKAALENSALSKINESEKENPIEQVVRELQNRKKSVISLDDQSPAIGIKSITENKTPLRTEPAKLDDSRKEPEREQPLKIEPTKNEPLKITISEKLQSGKSDTIKEDASREDAKGKDEESSKDVLLEKTEPSTKPVDEEKPNEPNKNMANEKDEEDKSSFDDKPLTNKNESKISPEIPEPKTPKSLKEPDPEFTPNGERMSPEKSIGITVTGSTGRGRGGRPRGKRGRGFAGGGRGRGGGRGGHHLNTNPSTTTVTSKAAPPPADVYEFRDDSEEERPRLILTIKPDQASSTSASTSSQAVTDNAPSTRKSRRLQEKDGSKTIVEEPEEPGVRSTRRPGRRATRSSAALLSVPTAVETTRKSPRRKHPREAASYERSPTRQPSPQSGPSNPVASPLAANSPPTPGNPPTPQPATPDPVVAPHTPRPATPILSPKPPTPQPLAHPQPLPANIHLPTSPEPVPKEQPITNLQPISTIHSEKEKEPLKSPIHKLPSSVPIALTQVATAKEKLPQPKDVKIHSVKEQILSVPLVHQPTAQPAQLKSLPLHKPIQTHHTVKLPPKLQRNEYKQMMQQQRSGEPTTLIDPVTGLLIPMREGEEGQYVPVSGEAGEPPPEKRPRLEECTIRGTVTPMRPSVVRTPQQPTSIPKPMSPPHLPQKPVVNCAVPRPPKAHLLQAVAAERAKVIAPPRPKLHPIQTQPIQAPKPPPSPLTPKAHILQAIGNAQAREGIIGAAAPHQGSILTGSVASPPLRAHAQPTVTGASSGRYAVKGLSDLSGRVIPEGGCIVTPSPSPQAPPRGQVMQAGLPVPAYEASLHGVVAELLPNPQWPKQPSPPPAHQHSTQTKGDVVQHVSYPSHHIQPAHYVHPQLVYQQYLREAALGPTSYHHPTSGVKDGDDGAVRESSPLELRRRSSPQDRTTDSPQVATLYGRPHLYPPPPAHRPAPSVPRHQVATPPHASQVPPQADSLLVLLQRYPVMWQGLLALKNDQAAVQMHFVFGNLSVAKNSLPHNSDGSTPPLRIAQRMRLEQTQLDGVARKMQMDNEHCMLLALPCGRDHLDVLQQSINLQRGFITYLQQKQAAGIVNIAAPGSQQAAYVVHIFPASDFANESLARIAPDLLHRVTDIAHLLIVIATC